MGNSSTDELPNARRAIASLISKSEKAQQKVAPEKWQDTMLRDNLKALRIASELIDNETNGGANFTREDLQEAPSAFAAMMSRIGKTQTKFPPGTPQHT